MVISDPTPTEKPLASESDSAISEIQPPPKPSQAEGERQPGASMETETQPAPKPSQAEGDRETVEEDLREKEQEGKI